MSTRRSRFIFVAASLLALCSLIVGAAAAGTGSQTAPGDPLDPRTYAFNNEPFLTVYATGVQKYRCQANGTWLFTDPEATLYKSKRTRKPIGTHFLNFATGRPMWQYQDGSTVEAARTASVPAEAGNIPWLLLQAVATTAGDDGDRFAKTTWVQRLNTSGGVAPAGACTPGATTAVPYGTDYVFWQGTNEDD